MSFDLTNPGLQYDQSVVDPATGLPIALPKKVFFKNPAARAIQFAKDATSAVQPSVANVSGEIPAPESFHQDEASGPLVPDASPSQPVATSMSPAPVAPLPKFFKPSFQETAQDANGNPAPINSGQSKLGKLLTVLGAAARGAAAGAGAPDFGSGFRAAQEAPIRMAAERQQLQTGDLQNQAMRANIGLLPFQRAQAMATLQKTNIETQGALDKLNDHSDEELRHAQAAQIPFETALKQAQTAAADIKEDPIRGLVRISTGEALAKDGGVGTIPADQQMATAAGIPLGTPVPLKVGESLKRMANEGVHSVQAGGRSLLVDSTGKTIKDLGAATPVVINNLNNGALNSGSDIPAGVTGDAALEQMDKKVAPVVKMVGDYKLDPAQALSRAPATARANFWKLVSAYNPDYDQNNYAAIAGMQKDFSDPGGKAGGSVIAFNTAISHMGLLKQAADALDNGKYPAANKIGNQLSLNLGSDKVSNFNSIKTYLGGELAKAFGGGVATDSSRSEAESILSSYQSPEQLHGMLVTATKLLQGKIGALEEFYKKQKGELPKGGLLDPESHKVLQGLGLEAGQHKIAIGDKQYIYSGSGDTADLANYTEVKK